MFTSPTTANVAENTTVVHTLTATDADLPAQTVGFSILGVAPVGDLGPGQTLTAGSRSNRPTACKRFCSGRMEILWFTDQVVL